MVYYYLTEMVQYSEKNNGGVFMADGGGMGFWGMVGAILVALIIFFVIG